MIRKLFPVFVLCVVLTAHAQNVKQPFSEETAKAFDLIINAFEDSNYEEYVLYYTGEYDASKSNENNGLTAHVVDSESFDEKDYFEAKGNQLVCYNKQTIKVPTFDGEISAKVVSIKVA
jgi:hypothetical protein